mgnify:CR=1 FL=1
MKELLTIFFRRKWHAIFFFIFMVTVPMMLAYILPPKYEAKATLLLTPGREKKPFLPDEKDARASFMQVSMEDVGSEVELLLSYPVLSVVVDKNHLDRDVAPPKEEYAKYIAYMTLKGINDSLIKIGLKNYVPKREDAIGRLSKKLNVEFIKRTNIISVKWRGSSPELAMNVVNAAVDAYLDHHIKVYGNYQAYNTVKMQMDDSFKRLTDMENRLSAYNSRKSISDIDNEHKVILIKLSEAESKTKILESLAMKDKEMATAELGNISGDPAFLDLSGKLTDAELRRIELLSKFGADDRKVMSVNKEIEEIKGFIKQRLKHNLVTWTELAKSYREQLNGIDRSKIDIDRMRRDLENLTQEYQLNKGKYNELLIAKNMDSALISSVKVVEYASISSAPVFPKRMIILIISLFFGTFGGLVYAFAFDKFSGRIMSVQDIESLSRMPVLSSVKQYSRNELNVSKDLIPVSEKLSVATGEGSKSILFVSPSPKAGTSFLCENLMKLISTNPNNLSVYVTFRHSKWSNEEVVTDAKIIFASLASISDYISRKNGESFDRLNININFEDVESMENIASELIKVLKERYKYLLLDFPSPKSGMYYLKFVPYADQIFLVAAYNITGAHPFMRMQDVIIHHQGKIVGCIFNRRKDVIPAFIYNRFF